MRDNAGAQAGFLTVWPEETRTIQAYPFARLREHCLAADAQLPAFSGLSLRTQLELADHRDRRQPGHYDADPATVHSCLLRAALADGEREQIKEQWKHMQANLDGPAWPPSARFAAGYALVDGFRRDLVDEDVLAASVPLLAAALAQLDKREQALKFLNLVQLCEAAQQARWCRAHLRDVESRVPDSLRLPLLLALMLSSGGSPDDAQAAMELVQHKVRPKLAALELAERDRMQAWATLAEAHASYNLAHHAPATWVPAARSRYRQLLDRMPHRAGGSWPERDGVWASLVGLTLLEDCDRLEECLGRTEEVLNRGLGEFPRSALLREYTAMLRFTRGDRPGLRAFAARELGGQVSPDPAEWFAPLLSALVTGRVEADTERLGRYFAGGRHPYGDYVRMILAWNLGGAASEPARRLMAERAKTIHQGDWERRLARGDLAVWREMLIMYSHCGMTWGLQAADCVEIRKEVFGGLENDAAFRTSRLAFTGQPYRTFLAEAHFYDALLQATTGEEESRPERMRQSLQRLVNANDRTQWEYHMAQYLLNRSPGRGVEPG